MEGIVGPSLLALVAGFVIICVIFRIFKYLNRRAINSDHHKYYVQGFAKVIDGDPIVIRGIEIRLSGIDAPETKQWGKTSNGKWYRPGEIATKALRNKLKRREIHCKIEGTCWYGRALGTLFLEDGTDVNAWMVREGHAFAYSYYGRQYERDEWIAKHKRINIHSGEVMEPWEWRRRRRYAETKGWIPTRQ